MSAGSAGPPHLGGLIIQLCTQLFMLQATPTSEQAAKVQGLIKNLQELTASSAYDPTALDVFVKRLRQTCIKLKSEAPSEIRDIAASAEGLARSILNPPTSFEEGVFQLLGEQKGVVPTAKKLLKRFKEGTITEMELIRGLKIIAPVNLKQMAILLPDLLTGPLAVHIPQLIAHLLDMSPQDIFDLICEGKTFGLDEPDLCDLLILFSKRDPSQLIENVRSLPLSLDGKILLLTSLLETFSVEPLSHNLLQIYVNNGIEDTLSHLKDQLNSGEIDAGAFCLNLIRLAYFEPREVAQRLPALFTGSQFMYMLTTLHLLAENTPKAILDLIKEGKTFGLDQEPLMDLILKCSTIDPTDFLEYLHLIPLNEQSKLAITIRLMATERFAAPKFFQKLMDTHGLETIRMQTPKQTLDFEGQILSQGICYGRVRAKIDEITTGNAHTASFARFIQAAQKIYKSQPGKIVDFLSPQIEKKFSSHPVEETSYGPLSALPTKSWTQNRGE